MENINKTTTMPIQNILWKKKKIIFIRPLLMSYIQLNDTTYWCVTLIFVKTYIARLNSGIYETIVKYTTTHMIAIFLVTCLLYCFQI